MELGPPEPTVLFTPATAGFAWSLRARMVCMAAISSKEVPSAAWVLTVSWPVSASGMNPLGTSRNRITVSNSKPAERLCTSRGRRSAVAKLRP